MVSKCRQSLRKAEDWGLSVAKREVRGIPVCLEGERPPWRFGEQVVLSPFARQCCSQAKGTAFTFKLEMEALTMVLLDPYCAEVSLGELQYSLPGFPKEAELK